MTNTDLKTGVVGELGTKAPARVATMANITLEGLQTVNGVALAADDIVLVNLQDDKTENGVYIASTGEWQRAVWFDDELDAVKGTLIMTVEGAQRANTLWQTLCDDSPIVFGTSEIEFAFFATSSAGGGGTYLLSGNNLDDVDSPSISRQNLGLEIGADVQAYSANLQALSGLTGAANKIPMFSGPGTMTLFDKPIQATESVEGLAKIATQALTNAGINDTDFITPLKLATWISSRTFTSTEQTITSASQATIPHGLGAEPNFISAILKCIGAEGGYLVGDKVIVNPAYNDGGTSPRGLSIKIDATNITVGFANSVNALEILSTTGGSLSITNSNWRLILIARI